MNKRVITFGEILLRLSVPSFGRFVQTDRFQAIYGGSEANVAVSLVNLGLEVEHVTRFPNNDLGKAAVQQLRKQGVLVNNIVYGDGRMGIYFLENGAMQRPSRIIYDRFDSAFACIKPGMIDWSTLMKEASWFHWTGITAAISQGAADACKEAIHFARQNQVLVSGDINYRRNLWQYGKKAIDIMPELIKNTDVIVAGVEDMDNCGGITGDSFLVVCQKFKEAFPNTKKIATTIRDSVSSSHNKLEGLLWDGARLLRSQKYDITHIVDRIGGGDAFMAGLIYGLVTKKSDQETIDFAVAASVLKHSIEGDANLVVKEEVETLMKGENTGKLLR
jgi:2-dehydro-3-deoxygluconokinase